MVSLDAVLERISEAYPKRIDLSVERVKILLGKLGHPEQRLAPIIHVAGTNGKGSTIAHMRAMLEANDKRVHIDTSPHLVRFNERFRLGAAGGGRLVSDEEMIEAIAVAEKANAGGIITYWELVTAAGFWLFGQHEADAVLLEVGLGGRYDATNVMDKVAASVIAPVSMDHAEFLGDTVAKIAGEKAAIIKRRCPVAVGRQSDEALAVILKEARTKQAPLLVYGEHWHVREERGRLVFEDDDGLMDLPLSRLKGRHQGENAGLAIAALKAANMLPPVAAIIKGLQTVSWPARMQPLMGGKLIRLLSQGAELWLDGGHNEDGGRVLAETLDDLQKVNPRELVMLCGLINTKDPKAVLAHFAPLKPHVYALPFNHAAALAADSVAASARAVGLDAVAATSLEGALKDAAMAAKGPLRVLIMGSLYLAGDVLAMDGTVPT